MVLSCTYIVLIHRSQYIYVHNEPYLVALFILIQFSGLAVGLRTASCVPPYKSGRYKSTAMFVKDQSFALLLSCTVFEIQMWPDSFFWILDQFQVGAWQAQIKNKQT